MDKGKGQISGAGDEGFIEMKRRKTGGVNGGNKHFKSVLVKPKTQYRPKAKQSTVGTASPAEVATGSKVTTYDMQEKGQCSVPLVEKINVIEKQILEGKLVLMDDDGEPLEKVDYPANSDNGDEVEPVENETARFLVSKGVGYGSKSLWEQWRKTTMDDEYDTYDDDMY
ncbi:hypothetical protein Tco_0860133 [Tanacetum coccineum]|uniref:Uncharacterized protein n=1 Tax=Tanacetum coccineum TaxID=301880 RepID=A0ABQ5BEN8_9ASTR